MAQAPTSFIPAGLEEVKPATTFLPAYSYAPYGQASYIPAYTQAYAPAPVAAGATTAAAPITSSQYIGTVPVPATTQQPIKGESRIEYIPYEKSVIEYEAVPRTEYVAREKKVVDHYAVEYQTEYIPQTYQDRYVEYVPQERVVERIEYTPVERQIVHQPQQEVVQQEVPVQTVQYQPVQYQTVQAVQPVQYQAVQTVQPVQYQAVQTAVQPAPVQTTVQPVQYQPLTTSYVAAPQGFAQTRGFQPILTSSFARPGQFVPAPVAEAPKDASKGQRKVAQRPQNEQSEPGFLDMLFGYPGNNQ